MNYGFVSFQLSYVNWILFFPSTRLVFFYFFCFGIFLVVSFIISKMLGREGKEHQKGKGLASSSRSEPGNEKKPQKK